MTLVPSGCWTCQVRHRKCDRETPRCHECSDRNIQCHGYGPKPSWMDGGVAEAQERSRIKAAVKSNFRQVRTRQNEARKARNPQSRDTAPVVPASSSQIYTPKSTDHESNDVSPCDTGSPIHGQRSALEQTDNRADAKGSGDLSAQEAGLVMYYLDHVFPWQFPYSSSQFRLGQRGWILWLLMRRGPFYDAAMSLASLHRRARNHDNDDGDEAALQRLCDFCQREGGTKLLENKTSLIEFLACGLFLISFEVVKGGRHSWQPHLAGITSIFGGKTPAEIMSFDGSDTENQELRTGLEFLLGHVLWFDILACISAETIPHLPHRSWLDVQELQTAEVMGCCNWVLLSIGNLAELQCWKRDRTQRGTLSVRELVDRSREIEVCLEQGLGTLGETTEATLESQVNWVSLVFTLAALVLLHTIVSGPQPALPEIKDTVRKGAVALRSGPKTSSFNGLMWAICVLGSMADEETQPVFDDVLTSMVRTSVWAMRIVYIVIR
ncbi:hypothetical protein PFICI_00554 [Pestalotiopsis fici W106-1]|uniref:Zn(2)-C6 fungal-type domain-containing protein n=1 Tax=Pestalotiopsis fici (strain W106-1 / CGMCC3.15140) TaxID=1229662 RepID=W3XNA6_PESFW|nr:uncharacterized protein PFICI_00554 [Pestalotiopsis fici W106-1]ETS86726.1 hypothetical protein PFICI_00554 [Pestalotiopsis fici W106-1]